MIPATAAITMVRKTVAIQTTFVDRIMVGMVAGCVVVLVSVGIDAVLCCDDVMY